MNFKIIGTLLTLATGAVLFCTAPAAAQTCSNQSPKGSYWYTVTGTVVSSFGPFIAGPFGAVGKIVFDGKGNVSTVRTFSDNGVIVQNDPGTGTYSMNSD